MRAYPSSLRPASFPLTVAALLLGTSLPMGGCADFDNPNAIEDLRVLGARTEPAELFYSGLYVLLPPGNRPEGFPMPEYEVSTTVYAFDPRGGLIESSMVLCPQQAADRACQDYEPEQLVERFEDEENKQEIRDAYFPVEQEVEVSKGLRKIDPSGPVQGLQYTHKLTDAVIDTILYDAEGNALVSPFALTPRFAIEVKNEKFKGEFEPEKPKQDLFSQGWQYFGLRNPALPPDAPVEKVWKELAYKRLAMTLNLFDPNLPQDTLDLLTFFLGIDLCDDPIDRNDFNEGRVSCLHERPPNEHPDPVGFIFVDEDDEEERLEDEADRKAKLREDGKEITESSVLIEYGDEAELSPTPLLEVVPGQRLWLRPVFPSDVRDPYQIFTIDADAVQTGRIELILVNRWEDIAITWYTTRGDGPGTRGNDFDSALDLEWDLPHTNEDGSEIEPGERDVAVGIIRDQRGGTAVMKVTVVYR